MNHPRLLSVPQHERWYAIPTLRAALAAATERLNAARRGLAAARAAFTTDPTDETCDRVRNAEWEHCDAACWAVEMDVPYAPRLEEL